MCGLAIALHVWLVVMSVAWVVDSAIVTIRRLVAVHTVSSWTPPPSSRPFNVGSVPVREGNVSTVKVSPSAGVKPVDERDAQGAVQRHRAGAVDQAVVLAADRRAPQLDVQDAARLCV